MPTNKM